MRSPRPRAAAEEHRRHLDFDEQGHLIGIEVLAASSKLPKYLLESAERLDAEGA
ncbi:DUF2283 domain-containing protein [Streptomyces sp. NPDC056291]|uniref:DUF2283 domain-containing protein n=1 Tax=Streptomyces sp. NPDC056291 TaxID=3345772 RepID=UPI0035E1EA80